MGINVWTAKDAKFLHADKAYDQDPVVQSIISLMSSLVVKMLIVLVSTISNSQVFLLQMQKLLTFFSAKILAYMPNLMIKV